jgi:hypothetical protein
MIFLISGKMRSGKDTTAEIIQSKLDKTTSIRNAGMLKWMAKEYFGWSGAKDKEGRVLLQSLGTDIVRHKLNYPDFWVDRVLDQIPILSYYFDHFAIPDVRFPNEIEKIKNLYEDEAVSIRIERSFGQDENEMINTKHPSETALDDYKFDYVIYNDGSIEQLEEMVDNLLKEILKGGQR